MIRTEKALHVELYQHLSPRRAMWEQKMTVIDAIQAWMDSTRLSGNMDVEVYR
jgi:hypothetical protein